MFKRLVAMMFIFVLTSLAWGALGLVTEARTHSTRGELFDSVAELWGNAHCQVAPEVFVLLPAPSDSVSGDGGGATSPAPDDKERVERLGIPADPDDKERVERLGIPDGSIVPPGWSPSPVALASSDIDVRLGLEYRRKGLLWFSTYTVDFAGSWVTRNPLTTPADLIVIFRFPTEQSIYDDFTFTLAGREADTVPSGSALVARVAAAPGDTVPFTTSYRSRGLGTWSYGFGPGVAQIRDFRLTATTDFKDIDYPPRSISPTAVNETPDGWRLEWNHENLISGFQLGVEMPEKLNPGPLATRITAFAPISLLFFFVVIFVLGVLRGVTLHPMHYFFLAAAFFSFHLLFAYLVDHLDVNLAFAVASVVSVGLVVSYLRIVAGNRFAFAEAGLAQLLYLVLFSYTHFLKGLTGLTVTIGAVLTLLVLMQTTARIDWDQVFAVGGTPGPSGRSHGA